MKVVSRCAWLWFPLPSSPRRKKQGKKGSKRPSQRPRLLLARKCSGPIVPRVMARTPRAAALPHRLSKQRPDLTTLTKRNGGNFPREQLAPVLRGQASPAAHGDPEMPVWGLVFWRASNGHEEEVQQRIAKLSPYIESLQIK